MTVNHNDTPRSARGAVFTRTEIRVLGAAVIVAAVASIAASVYSAATGTDLFGGGISPASEQEPGSNG